MKISKNFEENVMCLKNEMKIKHERPVNDWMKENLLSSLPRKFDYVITFVAKSKE